MLPVSRPLLRSRYGFASACGENFSVPIDIGLFIFFISRPTLDEVKVKTRVRFWLRRRLSARTETSPRGHIN